MKEVSEDQVLWQKFCQSNQKALDALYLKYVQALHNYGSKVAENQVPVEDAIQDIFVDLWQRRATLCLPNEPRVYLFQALRYRIIHLKRKQQKTRPSPVSALESMKKAFANYWGLVHQVDLSVGKIMEYLKGNGLDDNTIVVFTSEHGKMLYKFGLTGKTLMYEESARAPLMIKVPWLEEPKTYNPSGWAG